MKKLMVFSLMLLLVFGMSSQAKAVIILDNFTFDFSGIEGLSPGTTISNIQQITYLGIAHAEVFDDTDSIAEVGELFQTDGLLAATQFIDNNGVIIGTSGLNSSYELTFDFSVDGEFISRDPVTGALSFVHLSPTNADGILDVYLDSSMDAATSTGDGYQDGTLIAKFLVDPSGASDGGVFTPLSYDGSDDSTFELLWAMSGVILDENGNDLTQLPYETLITITDSNFDADPTNVGAFSISAPTSWPHSYTGAGSEVSFFALEDGSARLGTKPIPEPATMMLLGSGLLVLGAAIRRREIK